MKKLIFAAAALVTVFYGYSPALACGIEGRATWGDGSKIDGSSKISTSWNGTKAYPSRGEYSLDLGSNACGKTITVYFNGSHYTEITLKGSGYTRLDIVGRK